MKRNFCILLLLLSSAIARAQFIGYYSPQGVISQPFNAVTTAGPSAVIRNLGQTIHILNYTQTSAVQVQIRLEGSYDNSTFFQISDDATEATQGQVIAIGYYPFIRANLLVCATCSGLTANYSGVSASPGNPYGFYNPSQQIRKTAFSNAPQNANATSAVLSAPYGSTAGFLVIVPIGGAFPGGSSLTVNPQIGGANYGNNTLVYTITSQTNAQVVPVAAESVSTVTISFTSGGASANTFSVYYVFYPPGAALPATAQPANTNNKESTATNATATVAINAQVSQRGHLFNVNARCSAGTAQVQVQDGATVIWSSGATEVGTTSFTKTWNPGLASSPGNTITVTLSTCGAANTGTLDVQGSAF